MKDGRIVSDSLNPVNKKGGEGVLIKREKPVEREAEV